MESHVLWFSDPESTDLAKVGGKGANLGRLTQKGFVVPPGFVIGTTAYSAHIVENKGLKEHIADSLSKVIYEVPHQLESCVSDIRHRIMAENIPAHVAATIEEGYKKLGGDIYVAVRSSGTAEDLEGASFAGLHDTYLDIKGVENLLDAVKRCWASMWTARAVSYRKSQGFDHFKTSIAVVVQTMVESEVAGVLFTANPINTATDEMLINASWGLGESVVSGAVTPDEYIVKNPVNAYKPYLDYDKTKHANFQPKKITTDSGYVYTSNPTWLFSPDQPRPSLRTHRLKVLERTIGSKETKIIRDPKTGNGTLHLDVPKAEREKPTLTDDQVIQLCEIGRTIMEAYDGFPQDIEWAFQDGQFYILQARPVTGVDFSWDAEVTASVQGNDDATDEYQIWSRNFPEEMWSGGISPLFFSTRCWGLCTCHSVGVQLDGYPELDYDYRRLWVYHKGLSYHNCSTDNEMIKLAIPPKFRAGFLPKLPASWHEDATNATFDWFRYITMFYRIEKIAPHMGWNWWRSIRDDYILNKERNDELTRYTPEQLKSLSIEQLKERLWSLVIEDSASFDPPWHGLLWPMREAINWLGWMVANWYDGGRPGIMMDLMTGSRTTTITVQDNIDVWDMANLIHTSKELSALFEKHPDAGFLEKCKNSAEGREFLDKYNKMVEEKGHRGHADRDMIFTRRIEDPMVDIRLWKALKGTANPRSQEEKVRKKLEETIEHVTENLRKKSFGALKSEAFTLLINFVHHSLDYRDNERDFMDRQTMAQKYVLKELNRRMMEKGLFDTDRDFYFLTLSELYDLFDGKGSLALAKAKIAARMRNFDKVDKKTINPPYYLQRGREWKDPEDMAALEGEGVYYGKTTSLGKVTGTARVVRELSGIGDVKRGEILIVHSTDPGWTPVFMYISGIVLETGGLISHAALLSREYGLPCVQLTGALNLIPDGATITVDGDAGMVIVHDNKDEPDELAKSA
ncbi:MAG: PEP/pyruvate-binding domain-containing protein [Desulfobacterales bacterium]|jgi:pyruvate,water dikinase|nr:PEP/pyruvate-binding domain-containing protein [Desulfobacterales bacterium]